MMKKHRASWARTAGGAAALALIGAAGLAVATPGFAQEDEAIPPEVIVNTPAQEPIIARQDIERLRVKCGERSQRNGDAIICSDSEARDPEVRAIMEKTRARVRERVAEAKFDRKEMK